MFANKRAWFLHLFVVLGLFGIQFLLAPYHHTNVARIMVLATFAIGYNVLFGYTGLMSLGHAMFFAAGMYGTGLSVYYWELPGLLALLVGVLSGVGLSSTFGAIALRTRGVSFLIVTMMFSQALYLVILLTNEFTYGDQGFSLSGILAPLNIGGKDWAYSLPAVKYNLALVVFAVAMLLCLLVATSPFGRVLRAIKENEPRTQLLGYNTYGYRLAALTVSGAICAAAGGLYALLFSYVGASFAAILYSIYPLLWTLLGGAGTVLGPLVGTGLMFYLVDIASDWTSSYLLIVGAVLVASVLWFPAGILGTLKRKWWSWLP